MMIEELRSTELYKQLIAVNPSDEGNLLENTDGSEAAQVKFIVDLLLSLKPEFIMEVGTNKALFSYVVSQKSPVDTIIYTFDVDSNSSKCVAILNKANPNVDIHFFVGDSRHTVPVQMRHMKKIANKRRSLAFIDGGHDYIFCHSDLLQAEELGTSHILVDDYLGSEDVRAAVGNFSANSDYFPVKNPYFGDFRGLILLKKQSW